MQIRPIKTKADHREALKPIEKLSGRRSAGSMRGSSRHLSPCHPSGSTLSCVAVNGERRRLAV